MRESITLSFYREFGDGSWWDKCITLKLVENGKEIVRLADMPDEVWEYLEGLGKPVEVSQ